jgi:hypothetical protein
MSVVNEFAIRAPADRVGVLFFAFDMPSGLGNQASAIRVTAVEAALQQSRTSAMSRG